MTKQILCHLRFLHCKSDSLRRIGTMVKILNGDWLENIYNRRSAKKSQSASACNVNIINTSSPESDGRHDGGVDANAGGSL